MEQMNQTHSSESSKTKSKNALKAKPKRSTKPSKLRAKQLLKDANSKSFGRKIKMEEFLSLALSLVTSQHIESLREGAKTNNDRRKEMMQIYIREVGPITEDAFLGFMMSDEFSEFKSRHFSKNESKAA